MGTSTNTLPMDTDLNSMLDAETLIVPGTYSGSEVEESAEVIYDTDDSAVNEIPEEEPLTESVIPLDPESIAAANESEEEVIDDSSDEEDEEEIIGSDDSLDLISMFDYIQANLSALENVDFANTAGFSRVPDGKYMLFCTKDAEDASLILVDNPISYWINTDIVPTSINVFNSGIVIRNDEYTVYAGKSNVFEVHHSETEYGIKTYSKSKTIDAVTITELEGRDMDTDVDTIKLHTKRISPRLYNAIKDKTTKEEIKIEVLEFMTKLSDLNHLVKLEKELIFNLGL